MTELTMSDIGMQELTSAEVEDVSGGILCVLVLCFAAGYGVGTLLYKAL
jgi:hypothetical protein